LQAVERAEPHVGNECVEACRLQHATRFLEAVVRDNVLAGLNERSLERLEQRGIVVHDEDLLAVRSG
jgi:hypothetical protein